MAESNKDQVSELTARLTALEAESQRLLAALGWSSTVRNILLVCLLGFVAVFGYLYYQLYNDVQNRKVPEIQRVIAERQDEILEPITREVMSLAQEIGPEVATAFQRRIEMDGRKYIAAFNEQRDILTTNLQIQLEDSANKLYEEMLNDQEKILREEFPSVGSESDQQVLRANMEKVYKQLVQRYYIDYFRSEIERMVLAIDNFPMADPDPAKGPLAQQVLYELMEMIQMMMVGSDDGATASAAAAPASSDAPAAEDTASTGDQ